MKRLFTSALLLFISSTTAYIQPIEFDNYQHLLISRNIENMHYIQTVSHSAEELISLMEEGYPIDSSHLCELIKLLDQANACSYATEVIIAAIESGARLDSEHLSSLLDALTRVNPSDSATTIILTAIDNGARFEPQERMLLAEVSQVAGARSNVEKIRKALRQRKALK